MSYRRYKRYKRRSGNTQMIKMRFQSFMDISTVDSSMQIITISAGGKEIINRCPAQFAAYKYYKIGSVSVKLVPASTLPVDPTGLSYDTIAGEPTVDPRDQLTPGLMRITNGEDVFEDITGMNDTTQHGIYNNMLLDPRWFKWMLQTGVKRYATPRYWQIGQLHQDKWPGSVLNLPVLDPNSNGIIDTYALKQYIASGTGETSALLYGSSASGFFQTGHSGRLGWLPTDGLGVAGEREQSKIASPPEVEVMKIILPKCFKTRYYYRMFITETVYFREPIVTMAGYDQYRPLDVFHYTVGPKPYDPDKVGGSSQPTDFETGGNYGNS